MYEQGKLRLDFADANLAKCSMELFKSKIILRISTSAISTADQFVLLVTSSFFVVIRDRNQCQPLKLHVMRQTYVLANCAYTG